MRRQKAREKFEIIKRIKLISIWSLRWITRLYFFIYFLWVVFITIWIFSVVVQKCKRYTCLDNTVAISYNIKKNKQTKNKKKKKTKKTKKTKKNKTKKKKHLHVVRWMATTSEDITLTRTYPVSILRKSISGRHRPVRVADGPMTVRCRLT